MDCCSCLRAVAGGGGGGGEGAPCMIYGCFVGMGSVAEHKDGTGESEEILDRAWTSTVDVVGRNPPKSLAGEGWSY